MVVLALLGLNAACGTATVVQCRADAVAFLPRDPGKVTPDDVQDLVGRLQACQASGDAGK